MWATNRQLIAENTFACNLEENPSFSLGLILPSTFIDDPQKKLIFTWRLSVKPIQRSIILRIGVPPSSSSDFDLRPLIKLCSQPQKRMHQIGSLLNHVIVITLSLLFTLSNSLYHILDISSPHLVLREPRRRRRNAS